MALVVQLGVLAAQVVVEVAQVVAQVAQVAVALEEEDLVQVSTWEETLVVEKQMENSRETCPQYSMGIVPKATSFCRNSTS